MTDRIYYSGNNVIYKGTLGTVKHNIERNLVEIYFDGRPSEKTIEALKFLRWRYFGKNRCWYNRYNGENFQLATSLCGEEEKKEAEKIDFYIGPAEVLVVTTIRFCIYKEHSIKRGTASINVLRNSLVKEITIPVLYCSECQVYYIFENDFVDAKKNGIICARVLTLKEFRSITQKGWEPVSIMRSFGYTVNANDNYSDHIRRSILEFLIENKIISAERIIDYLAWFSRTHRNQEHMEQAIEKWDSDRMYILSYIPGNFRIRVRDIYVKRIKYVK